MNFNFDDEELGPKIMIMDGGVGDEALTGDIICTIDIEIDEILQWLEKNKYTNSIDYKGKRYKESESYLNLFFSKIEKF